jgi:hypothetical protein
MPYGMRRPPGRGPTVMLVRALAWVLILANLGVLVWYVWKRRPDLFTGGHRSLLVATPAQLDFGAADAGTKQTRPIVIRNRTKNDVEIASIAFTNTSFSLEERPYGITLAPGQEVELTVVYEARAGGVNKGEMQFWMPAESEPELVVPVRAVALLPRLVVTPETIRFGEVTARADASRKVTLRNGGTRPLKITTVSVRGDAFALARPFAAMTLEPEASMVIDVVFAPSTTGAFDGEVVISSDDPDSATKIVSLSASYGITVQKERDKAAALALLQEAKRELTAADAYLSYRSTNKLLMRDRHRMGQEAFEKAWPKYERANEMLKAIDPALEDTEFFVDSEGHLQRRTPSPH